MKLNEFLKQKRVEKKLTQKEIADQLFISDKTYSQYERGERNADIQLFFKMINLLNIDTKEITTVSLDHALNKFKQTFNQVYEELNGKVELSFQCPDVMINEKLNEQLFFMLHHLVIHMENYEKKKDEPLKINILFEKDSNMLKIRIENLTGEFKEQGIRDRNEFYHTVIKKRETNLRETFGDRLYYAFNFRKNLMALHFKGEGHKGTTIEFALKVKGVLE